MIQTQKIYKSMDYLFFFLQNPKNPILECFWTLFLKWDFFKKNPALSVFYPQGTLTSCEASEKPYEPFRRKRVY